MALDGGLIKEADGCLLWVLSLCSKASAWSGETIACRSTLSYTFYLQMVLSSHS